mmetsp:Transcript_12180/g.18401  ORF Transcript_12180/g.18401 Transcript_12180/m.18401 type:complete len:666 (-) Transcript_12180:254-2251(-)|eukprot:CAMPEP_0185028630 /NCGR_PEP_ID=MMETSP1103-20130426/14464_1 /TAXON_ID=36769 /ORGANISM="Paraphysomonas bandaiensis, Strain Caron Lab Isolate" /LENGTH=665 /DNA_ID=CAMNT_0027563103 /DNA_START=94 /DNA_END=2091 /DNA_ORIENTATION=+
MSGDAKEVPSATAVSMREGYNQTYVIYPSAEQDEKDAFNMNEVFFRCGNWCYKGPIDFSGTTIGTADLPIIIPTLQRQQGSLRYYCNTSSISVHPDVSNPLDFVSDACEFIAKEITSEHVDRELNKWSSVFSWIDDDNASTYFELTMDPPPFMKKVSLVASKTYSRGLIIIAIYFEGVLYFVLQAGEGDQHLLDVRFPNVSSHGQGLHIASYPENLSFWKKLTLWHTLTAKVNGGVDIDRDIPKLSTSNLSSDKYIQTYCIMKSEPNHDTGTLSVHHEALFRFGSWCYTGRVQLTPVINLTDVPYVIPALRMQQSRLNYFCDVNRMPNASYFTKPMELIHSLTPFIEEEIYKSEETLRALIDRLSRMGLGESVTKWLEGDSTNSFFEFRLAPTPEMERALKRMELIASKCYHPSGIITITIVFQKVIYVSVVDGGEENPLLDSRFPDVSAKGRGYQLQSYPDGIDNWPSLRRVTIWQTVAALEQEFRDRAARLAEAKRVIETGATESTSEQINPEDSPATKDELSTPAGAKAALTRNSHSFTDHVEDAGTVFDDEYDIAEGKQRQSQKASIKGSSVDVPRSNSLSECTASEKGGSDVKGGSSVQSSAKGETPPLVSRLAVARPHHLPKMDSLSKKLDQIRAEMGEEGARPNWNSFGKPLRKLGEK